MLNSFKKAGAAIRLARHHVRRSHVGHRLEAQRATAGNF